MIPDKITHRRKRAGNFADRLVARTASEDCDSVRVGKLLRQPMMQSACCLYVYFNSTGFFIFWKRIRAFMQGYFYFVAACKFFVRCIYSKYDSDLTARIKAVAFFRQPNQVGCNPQRKSVRKIRGISFGRGRFRCGRSFFFPRH